MRPIVMALFGLWAGMAVSNAALSDEKPVLAGPEHGGGDATAQPRTFTGDAGGGRGDGERLQAILDALQLTEAQEKKVNQIIAEHTQAAYTNRRLIQRARADVAKAREAGNKNKLKQAQDELKQLEAQTPRPGDLFSKLVGLLSSDQKATLRTVLISRGEAGRAMRSRDPLERFVMATQLVDLTDAQREAIDKKIQQHRAEVTAFEQKHGEQLRRLESAAHKAREDNDKQTYRATRSKIRELRANGPNDWKTIRQITESLPEAQRAALVALRESAAKAGRDRNKKPAGQDRPKLDL